MADFVLVHGAWPGAWCWDRVAAELRSEGHAVPATDSLVTPNMVPAPDWSTISIKPEALRDVFAADAAPGQFKLLESLAKAEAAAPFSTRVHTSDARFGMVPRSYVKTALDRAVTPILQKSMLAATPCADVVTLEPSHTPFFVAPARLVRALVDFGSRQARCVLEVWR